MNAGIVIAPDKDNPDERDSAEFQSQARMFASRHSATLLSFDNEAPMVTRALAVLAGLDAVQPGSCEYVALFSHGWRRGVQAGFDLRGKEAKEANGVLGLAPHFLADALARVAKRGCLIVPLYCCSTAEDQTNGFAAQLSRMLSERGVDHRLFSHTTAGHTTRNPFVRVFGGSSSSDWLVSPSSPLWHAWVVQLHDLHGMLALDYPLIEPFALRALLGG